MHVIAEAGNKLNSQMHQWFAPRKSVNIIYNTNKLKQKKKNPMIFPINAERHLIKCSSLNKIPKNRTRRKTF